jgi:hypothetical protein
MTRGVSGAGAVKADVDPGRLFRANHSIDPTG